MTDDDPSKVPPPDPDDGQGPRRRLVAALGLPPDAGFDDIVEAARIEHTERRRLVERLRDDEAARAELCDVLDIVQGSSWADIISATIGHAERADVAEGWLGQVAVRLGMKRGTATDDPASIVQRAKAMGERVADATMSGGVEFAGDVTLTEIEAAARDDVRVTLTPAAVAWLLLDMARMENRKGGDR